MTPLRPGASSAAGGSCARFLGPAAWWCGRVRVRRALPLRRFSAATQAPCAELSLSSHGELVL